MVYNVHIPDNPETIIERDIISAFGSSIIEFEADLYQKFLRISAATSLFSETQFKKALRDLHAKGYLSPTEFNGRSCWKRLIVLDDLEKSQITPAEFEDVFRKKPLMSTSGGNEQGRKQGIVSNSSLVAEELRKTMLTSLSSKRSIGRDTRDDIQTHAMQMRKALSNSSEEFLRYVRKNLPTLLEPMQAILKENGENVVLLGLRIVSTT